MRRGEGGVSRGTGGLLTLKAPGGLRQGWALPFFFATVLACPAATLARRRRDGKRGCSAGSPVLGRMETVQHRRRSRQRLAAYHRRRTVHLVRRALLPRRRRQCGARRGRHGVAGHHVAAVPHVTTLPVDFDPAADAHDRGHGGTHAVARRKGVISLVNAPLISFLHAIGV